MKRIVLSGSVAHGGSWHFAPPSRAEEEVNRKKVLSMLYAESEEAERREDLVFMLLRARRDQILLKERFKMPVSEEDEAFLRSLSPGPSAGEIFSEPEEAKPFLAFQNSRA
jgi:hypothetical protein